MKELAQYIADKARNGNEPSDERSFEFEDWYVEGKFYPGQMGKVLFMVERADNGIGNLSALGCARLENLVNDLIEN